MKLSSAFSPAFLSLCLAVPALAQTPPVPAAPANPPPPPGQLLPPPADPAAAPAQGPFKDAVERQSYGLGIFLGNREKANAVNNPGGAPLEINDLLKGLADGLKGEKSLDYAAGLAMAAQIKRSELVLNEELLTEAIRTAAGNQLSKLSPAEVQAVMQEIQNSIQQRQQAKLKAEAEKNLASANAWLAENATKEGVKTSASGLQYRIETPGTGKTPGPRDVVMVELTGTTVDGTEFDRTPEGAPARKAMMALPKGLQEGLQMLKVGGKAKFWLPPALGYGDVPRGQIKAQSILVYEVALTGAEDPPAAQAAPIPALGPDGRPVNPSGRPPVTAVTPPVSVEIPPGGGAPKITVDGKPLPPQAPPAAPANPATPPPAAPPAPAK